MQKSLLHTSPCSCFAKNQQLILILSYQPLQNKLTSLLILNIIIKKGDKIMLCKKCNAEIENGAAFCPFCGEAAADDAAVAEVLNDAAPKNKILDMLSDKLYMVMCILLSVSVGMGLIGGSFNILGILILIFMWLIFVGINKGNDVRSNMRSISGTLYAEYIILIVAAAILGVALLICVFAFLLVGTAFYEEFSVGLTEGLAISGLDFDLSLLGGGVTGVIIGVILVIFIILIAVMIVGIITTKKLHAFAKELYQNLDTPEYITKAASGRTWIIVSAVFACMSVFSAGGLTGFISAGCNAAIYILAAILIKKHLISEQNA